MENMPISISLTTAQWNVVLGALAAGPFNQVAEIIAAIRRQGDEAIRSATPQEEPVQE